MENYFAEVRIRAYLFLQHLISSPQGTNTNGNHMKIKRILKLQFIGHPVLYRSDPEIVVT
jgi:hypothetical protein